MESEIIQEKKKRKKPDWKKISIISLGINIAIVIFLIFILPSLLKICLMKGFDYCYRSVNVYYDKYLQNNIPLKVMNDGYWQMRIWFNEETQDLFHIKTLEDWEKDHEFIRIMTNKVSLNFLMKIKRERKPIYPVDSFYRVTSFYGWRNMHQWDKDNHPGLDLSIDNGTPIKSMDDGVVILSDWYGDYGRVIFITHSYGITSIYGHLSKRLVNVGDKVGKGQIIALSGNTGESTGPHLHFELRYLVNPKNVSDFGERINPLLLLS